MLILYQKESCHYCAQVRRELERLELDYMIMSMPEGSFKRAKLQALAGKQQVPFLVDTDHDVMLLESLDIINYLQKTYGR